MDWKRKLSSRKFWAMVANFISCLLITINVAQTSAERIAALVLMAGTIIAYILGESAIDAAGMANEDADE